MNRLVSLLILLAPTLAFADKAKTIDCAKQPTYEIRDAAGSYAFTGTCTKITVTGAMNHLAIENVNELIITGANNTAAVVATDSIKVSGSNDTVSYKKAMKGDKPNISIVGSNSKVEQSK